MRALRGGGGIQPYFGYIVSIVDDLGLSDIGLWWTGTWCILLPLRLWLTSLFLRTVPSHVSSLAALKAPSFGAELLSIFLGKWIQSYVVDIHGIWVPLSRPTQSAASGSTVHQAWRHHWARRATLNGDITPRMCCHTGLPPPAKATSVLLIDIFSHP
jgi:hypothetical protein